MMYRWDEEDKKYYRLNMAGYNGYPVWLLNNSALLSADNRVLYFSGRSHPGQLARLIPESVVTILWGAR